MVVCLAPLRTTSAQSGQCPEIDTTAIWVQVNRAWSNEAGLHWSNDSLRRVLLELVERDQGAREGFGARVTDTTYIRRLVSLDSSLAATMSGILERYGLPTKSLVGPEGSDAGMLIVQHNWPLQERVLAMAKSAPRGQISPEKLAILEDRVLVHQGKPQRLGSQFTARPDGVFTFAPLADTTKLDARRAAVGMPPMRQYVCMMDEAGLRVDRTSLPAAFRP